MEKSPVCSLFSVRTDRVEMGIFGSKTERTLLTIPDSREDDNDVNRNDNAIECMRSPGEDDHVEMSMKSVILSSDEYSSSSESEEEDNSRGNKEKGKEEATKPHQDLVKHKPPKSKWSEKLGEVIELEKLNSGDTDLAVVSSIVLSSDEYSQDSGEDNIFTTDITDTELTKPVVCLPKKPVLKKRVSFGSIKDEYWEEHWNTFWRPQSASKVEANDDVNDLESDKVNSREFIPSIIDLSTGTNENGTDSDDVCKITTSTPSHLLGNRKLGDIMGSSSSDGFSPMDTGNSSGDSVQEAILRAIAVLEYSEDSRSSNIKMQSITPETQSSCPESESSHTSEWESDMVTSGSSISNLSSKEHLTDISRAGSIDEMANIISKACTQHAVQTVKALSTQTPLQQGHRFLSPSESFVPSSLVSIPRILYTSSTPITNLASQLYEHAVSESCEKRLEDIDVYMTVKSERGRIVPSNEESKRLRFNQKDVKVAYSKNENIGFGNKKLWEWNNNFLSESSEIGKWESVEGLIAVEQVAESIVKPTTLADEFLISQRPRIRDDATLIANLNVHNGWCQTKFFPSVKSNTPTPAKRRRSYFPDLTGDLQEPEESLLATPRIRYFKSPGSPEHSLDADHVPDSCDRVSVTEKLPMLHNIGLSPPVVGKIYEGSDKPRLDDDKYLSSPVIPYMRGKLSTTIDVLQESPESGRCSKELDISDPKSVDSTPIGDSYSSPDVVECSFKDSTVNSPDGDIVSFNENAHNGRSPNNYETSLTKLSENKNVRNDAQNLGDVCDTTLEFSKGSLEFDTPNKCPEPDWKLPIGMDLPVQPRDSEDGIRSFTTGLYPNKQTSGYDDWSNYDGNECTEKDLNGRGEKLPEGVGPVVTSESSSHNAAEITADSNFQNGGIGVKRLGSAVENDAMLNKDDDGGNQIRDNPELTNVQEVIDITHEETSDSTHEEINDNTNEEEMNDNASEEVINDSTNEAVIIDTTNEEEMNDNTSEEVIIDTTNEEELNDNTSEKVVNDSTTEAVVNNNTNEEEMNNTSEEVINDSTNEAEVNNNTNEEIVDTTNEEEINDNASEEIINDSKNEEEIIDTTNDVEINDSVGEVTLSEDEASNNGNLEDISGGNDEISTVSIQDDVDHYGNVDRLSEEEAFDNEDDNSCTETLNRDFVHEDDMNKTESSQYDSSAKDKDMNHILGPNKTTVPPSEENCGNGVDDLDPAEQRENDTDTKSNDEDMKETSRENDKDQDDAEEEYRKEYCRNRIYDVKKAFEENVDENEDNSWETINSDLDLDGAETFDGNKRVREW